MHYGATPEEWFQWSVIENLTPDLLPVVCKPGEPIYEKSNLVAYGKVPSRYTVRNEVMGFTNWTSHQATDADLTLWSAESRYGICLQTRQVRALDFDVTDQSFAAYLQDALSLLGYDFPWRTRANSPKFLTLFYLEGDYGKQTLTTEHGVIEFLATGQQCVVAGTHPSGARYEWDWRTPIPTFTADRFAQLLRDLQTLSGAADGWSAPSRSRVVDRGRHAGWVDDPVVEFLTARGLALRTAPDGRVFLHCPWADNHTTQSDVTATCWFPAGTAGFEQGHFRCLHAHCQTREDWEFLREVGYDAEGFEYEGPATVVPQVHPALVGRVEEAGASDRAEGHSSGGVRDGDTRSDPSASRRDAAAPWVDRDAPPMEPERHRLAAGSPVVDQPTDQGRSTLHALDAHVEPSRALVVAPGSAHPLDLPAFERDKNGKIKPIITNVALALRRPDLCGAVIAKDAFKDALILRPWDLGHIYQPLSSHWTDGKSRPFAQSDYTELHYPLRQLGFGPAAIPKDIMREAALYVAEKHQFDSAINWIDTLPEWDGINRIDTFMSQFLGAEDTPYTRAVARYWWTAHAGRILAPGCQADMAVVLISQQGTGKTSSLKAIAPQLDQYVEINLHEKDDDISRALRGKLVGELAELRGLGTRDADSIKAWVSRGFESWIPKYQEFSSSFPRRLVLIGTSNQPEFLSDETGNRRWLPVEAGKQLVEKIHQERFQLWVEAVGMYLWHGILWSEAETLGKQIHRNHMVSDEWQVIIQDWLDADDGFGGGRPADREHLVMNDILQRALNLNPAHINMSTQFRVGKILRKLGYSRFTKRIGEHAMKVWAKGVIKWGM